MRIQLSSHLTFFYRGVFPVLAIVVAAVMIPLAHQSSDSSVSVLMAINLAIWIPYAAFVIWFTLRLRTVWIVGSDLVVDGPEGNRCIPLRQVARISESRFWTPKMIQLHIRSPNGVEERIVFLAPWALQLPFSDHPVVRLLLMRIDEVRSGADRDQTAALNRG